MKITEEGKSISTAAAVWLDSHSTKRAARLKASHAGWAIVAILLVIAGSVMASNGTFSAISRPFATGGAGGLGCSASGSALPLTGAIVDKATGVALGATTTIDVIVPSVNGWTKPYESPTQSSSVFTSTNKYPPCTEFFLHVSSSAGNHYYDALFGPYQTGVAPWGLGSTTSCNNCAWAQGTQLGLYQATTSTNQKWLLVDSKGASCGTATGGAADSHTTVQAGNTGAATTTMTLTLTIAGSTASSVTNYGVSWPYITPTLQPPGGPGPGTTTLGLTAWYATNQTTGNAWITQNGWTPTSIQPFPNVGTLFYKTLNGVYSSKTGGGTLTLTIPLDLSQGPGAGKRVQTAIWVTDNQLPSDSATAVTDGAPTAYGAYSAVGPTANAFSFTSFTSSAGRWTGYLINCAVTE